MSVVLERVREKQARAAAKLAVDVRTKPMSQLVRGETWADHQQAQYSPFEVALAKGTISREGYGDLLGQVIPIYEALTAREAELADDPVASRVIFPELERRPAVEADLAFFAGPDWAERVELLDVSREYAERIRNANPIQFVAHHYNRYLADLSGGLMIAAALKRAWDLDGDGLRYYDFADIPDANAWKTNYRNVLDTLPIDDEQKTELVFEVIVAYEYNIVMAEQLAERHLTIVAG
jgi:heme oxygenase